jgi:hypothetical protein
MSSMSRCMTLLLFVTTQLMAPAAWAQIHEWSQRFGSTSSESGLGVTVDGSNNAIVTGRFRGTVDFGGGPLTEVVGAIPRSRSNDIFVAKYDHNGNHVWSQSFGDTLEDQGFSVVADGLDNVIVTGFFKGTVDFGGGPLTEVGTGTFVRDIFVVKFDSNGNHVWSKRFGASSGDEGQSIAVDGSDNVIVTGFFHNTVDFGGGPLTSAGSQDIFVAKYDPDGNHLWSKRFGQIDIDPGYGVAVDGSNNVIVTGYIRNTVDFGGGPLTSAGCSDIFVAKFDTDGNHVWSQRFGDDSCEDEGFSVAVDGSGNVVVTGKFRGTVDFGGGPMTSAGFGSLDIFVARFDPNGNHLWSKSFGSASSDFGNHVAADGLDNVIITGRFGDTVDFGGGTLSNPRIFVAKFDSNGNHLWSQAPASPGGNGHGFEVVADGQNSVIVTGAFGNPVDFGGGPLTSAGALDIFLVKFESSTVQVELEDLEALSTNGTVKLTWRFSSEARRHLLGIGVQRANTPDGPYADRTESPLRPNTSMLFEDFNVEPGRTYWYRLVLLEADGIETMSSPIRVTVAGASPGVTELSIASDADAGGPVEIRYRIGQSALVNLTVFDVRGRQVRHIYHGVRGVGEYLHLWRRRDEMGRRVPRGVYLVQLTAGAQTLSKKAVLIRE